MSRVKRCGLIAAGYTRPLENNWKDVWNLSSNLVYLYVETADGWIIIFTLRNDLLNLASQRNCVELTRPE